MGWDGMGYGIWDGIWDEIGLDGMGYGMGFGMGWDMGYEMGWNGMAGLWDLTPEHFMGGGVPQESWDSSRGLGE